MYKKILGIRAARIFDIAGFLMRFYAYMMNIGTVTMLTLAGYSFLTAGLASSLIAIVIFLISPRVSKLADELGQHKIVPTSAAIAIIGLSIMLITVQAHGPEPLLFAAAVLMGFIPNAQALVRARWTYLLRSGRLGEDSPSIRTVFSYEGMIDDIGFMFGPSVSIAIAAATIPIGGLLTGGILFAIGAAILSLSRSTEPIPGWASEQNSSKTTGQSASTHNKKSVFREYPIIRVLFTLMLLVGAFFGVFDVVSVSFAEDLGNPNIASIGLIGSAIISATVGLVFGMTKIRLSAAKQLLFFACFLGITFAFMAFINNVPMFLIISYLGGLFYSPFFITANSACECAVPNNRITEAITWINAGMTCGSAFGPSIAGVAIDTIGSIASFKIGAIIALCIPITALLFRKLILEQVRSSACLVR